MVARWRCNCIFCRIFVHPVLRRIGGLSESREAHPQGPEKAESSAPEERPVQAAPLSAGESATQVSAEASPQPGAMPAQFVAQEVLEGIVSKVVEDVRTALEENEKILVERLDRIEENVGKLRKEIQGLVSSMENVIVEFREAISELTNPLIQAPAVQSSTQPRSESMTSSSVSMVSAPPPSARLAGFVKPLLKLLDKANEKVLVSIIDEYVKNGIVSQDEGKKLKVIVSTIARLRKQGVDDETITAIIASMLSKEVSP